jgi:hypothetical protein
MSKILEKYLDVHGLGNYDCCIEDLSEEFYLEVKEVNHYEMAKTLLDDISGGMIGVDGGWLYDLGGSTTTRNPDSPSIQGLWGENSGWKPGYLAGLVWEL